MTDQKTTSFLHIDNLLDTSKEVLKPLQGAVVAVGNFDGVHKGHRVVLDTACMLAAQNGDSMPAVAMTFEPHPRTVFNPSAPVFRLTPSAIKARLFHTLGLQGMAVVPFDRDFSNMSADAFVQDLLVDQLKVSHVVVGYDFHFGKGRQGSPEFLIEMGKQHGFGVSIVPAQKDEEGELVFSSSATRDCLAKGEIDSARDILGYRYFISGEIIHGEKRGRDLGYPTANIALSPDNNLRHGIYAVYMRMDGKRFNGVASFGRRPTFDNGAPLLETFLFDFSGNLYGKNVEIVFVRFLRGEEKFDTLDALISQMDQDSLDARQVLDDAIENADDKALIDEALDEQAI